MQFGTEGGGGLRSTAPPFPSWSYQLQSYATRAWEPTGQKPDLREEGLALQGSGGGEGGQELGSPPQPAQQAGS